MKTFQVEGTSKISSDYSSVPLTEAGPMTLRGSLRVGITSSENTELIDVTDLLTEFVSKTKLRHGFLYTFCPHTTCGLMINEDEEGFHEDLGSVLERVAARDRYWAHDDWSRRWQNLLPDERRNGHSHIRAALIAHPFLAIPVIDQRLALGPWQRLFVVELDGGRHRALIIQAWGSL